ncbi:hypothetical protein NQ314_013389 [Rhamnusium bicolor]|uniref:Uncharacterized protein n=1 Tax=Rhamnusium bicolor TaxID=1586634 RepID=A0AAV8X5R2_9CUCU|nr:hypothetical protein NQ314_013389 [Rhamnusium bicolor]
MPWFDREVQNKISERELAYKNFTKTGGHERQICWNNYKLLRNTVVNPIKFKKQKYYCDEINKYVNNPKQMWKTLKKLVNGNKHVLINHVQFEFNDQIIVENDLLIATNFNVYFVSSIENIICSISNNGENNWHNINCNLYKPFSDFKILKLTELVEIVKSLDNKYST